MSRSTRDLIARRAAPLALAVGVLLALAGVAGARELTTAQERSLTREAARAIGGAHFACLRPLRDEYMYEVGLVLDVTSRRALDAARLFKLHHPDVVSVRLTPGRFARSRMLALFRRVQSSMRPYPEARVSWTPAEGLCPLVEIRLGNGGSDRPPAEALQRRYGDRVRIVIEPLPVGTSIPTPSA